MQRMDANQQQTAAVLGGLVGAVGDLQLNHDRLQGEHDGRRADHDDLEAERVGQEHEAQDLQNG